MRGDPGVNGGPDRGAPVQRVSAGCHCPKGPNSGVGDDGSRSVEPGGGERGWRELRSNPDYVADWRAHAGEPAPLEPAQFPLRAQTVADLTAARWGLLAWEDPRVGSRASPFWADVPMVKGVVAKPEGPDGEALSNVVCESDATYTGLRLRDGTFILKVERGGKAEQIKVIDAEGFDPMGNGLEVAVPVDVFPPTPCLRSQIWPTSLPRGNRQGF